MIESWREQTERGRDDSDDSRTFVTERERERERGKEEVKFDLEKGTVYNFCWKVNGTSTVEAKERERESMEGKEK